MSDPPLAIVEGQFRYNQGEQASGLPGRVKVGAFGHFGRFEDQRFVGLPVAQPPGLSPNGGLYGIVDQQIYRVPDEASRDKGGRRQADGRNVGGDGDDKSDDDGAKGVGVFARVIGAPSDRNLVDLYVDAGFSALGLVPNRPDDQFGIAGAIAKISSAAVAADEAALVLGDLRPVRSFEAVVEATYQAEVVPGVSLQPTVQYVIHPGGNVSNPYGVGPAPIPNAAIFGVTTTIRF